MDQVWIPFHATSNDYLWHFYLLWLALLLYFSKKSLLSPKSHLRTFYSQVSSTCPFHLKFSGLPRQPVKKYPLWANLEVGPVYFNWFPIWKLCQIGLVPIQFRPAGHLGDCPWKCESETFRQREKCCPLWGEILDAWASGGGWRSCTWSWRLLRWGGGGGGGGEGGGGGDQGEEEEEAATILLGHSPLEAASSRTPVLEPSFLTSPPWGSGRSLSKQSALRLNQDASIKVQCIWGTHFEKTDKRTNLPSHAVTPW